MSVETIGAACSAGWVAHARCNARARDAPKSSRRCLYARELDMETLLLTRGPNFPLHLLPSRLLCPRCGQRDLSVIYYVPAGRQRDTAS